MLPFLLLIFGKEKASPDKDANKKKDGPVACSAHPRVETVSMLEGILPQQVAGPSNVNSTPECTSMDDKSNHLSALVSGLLNKLDGGPETDVLRGSFINFSSFHGFSS